MITIWTIYQSPSDYPDRWVVRAFTVPGGPRPEHFVCDTLEHARACVPAGLFRLPRMENDEPQIYETWL